MSATIYLIQMTTSCNALENVEFVAEQLAKLPAGGEKLVCLPEACLAFNRSIVENQQLAENHLHWRARYAELCQTYGVWLAVGSMPVPAADGRYYAASILFNREGKAVAEYHKLHLFDADVSDGTKRYRESQGTAPGQHLEVVDTPFGRIGMAICYDMRFPSLFQQLRKAGAELILVPSAFTTVTGAAHWEVLLRSRAIETQCFVIAAAQVGVHQNGRETYGHSMVISPWGTILAEVPKDVTTLAVELDFTELQRVRQAMPLPEHSRFAEQLI
ncbi:carbon-nitrogen hydrolase family protein [Pseudoalteromonas fenneropenaei]|uniref:Carbon-nitrogen hydrolase family protein n=1 Tax=Pseudoalteromonas fenneropenaei TaxID=1737459 RepID=A0ABV7CK23_9GAMM